MDTDTEVVECYLPNDDSIDGFFSYSNKEKVKIIELGLSLYKNGLDTIKFWDNSDWETKIQTITSKSEEQIKSKESEIEKLKNQLIVKDTDFKRQKDDLIRNIQTDYENQYKLQITSLRTNITDLTSQLGDWSDKYNNLYQTLDDKHQERLKEHYDRSDETIKRLRDELNKQKERYEQQLIISQNSTLKGQQGEEHTFKQLNLLFPSAEVQDTHNEAGRGDFIVRLDDIVFMVENKNYSKNVQKSEIDKFYRDLDRDSNNDIQCAVLVSMHTGICGREDFEFEVRNNKPILFLHKLSSNFTNLELAFKFFKLIINQKDIDLNNKEIAGLFKNMANSIKRNFKKLKKQLDKFHSDQTQTLLQNEEDIINLYKTMKLTY